MKYSFRNLSPVFISLILYGCLVSTPDLALTPTQTTIPEITPPISVVSTPTEQPISISAHQRIGNGDLEQVKWTKDGENIVVGTGAGVFIYDADDFALLNEFEVGHSIYYLTVHPFRKIISVGASRDNYQDITLWDIQNGKPITTLHGNCGCVFTNVAFSPNGSLLAVGNDKGQVWIWEWVTGNVIQTLEFENQSKDLFIRFVQFSPDGSTIAAGSGEENGRVVLFDLNNGKRVQDFDNEFIFLNDLEFSPDGKRLAIAGNLMGADGLFEKYKVKVFDSTTGDFIYAIDLTGESMYFVAFSPDNNSLTTGSCKSYGTHSEVCLKAQIERWDISNGAFIEVIKEYASSLVSLDYSPDGMRFSAITWDITPLFETWDIATNQAIKSIEWNVGPSSSIIFSPDSKTAIWGETNGAIKFLDIDTISITSILNSDNGEIVNLAISADGSMLASSSRYGAITLWDFHTGEVLQRIQTRENFQIYSIRFSQDNRWLAWTEEDLYRMDENQIQIYDIEFNRPKLTIMGTSFDVAISPDSSMIAFADFDDNKVQLFDIATGELLMTFIAPDSIDDVEFNANGSILVADCINTNILFWEISSGKLIKTFDAYSPSDVGSVPFVLFPGDKFLVFSTGPRIKILDLTKDQLILEKTHFIGSTRIITVSPDGETMATSGPGGAAWIWKVSGGH